MSPKTSSTALAAILMLSATPILAQSATDAPAEASQATEDAAAAAQDAANSAADAAGEAADSAAAAAGDAAENVSDAAEDAAASADPAETEANDATSAPEAATEATEADAEAAADAAETAPSAGTAAQNDSAEPASDAGGADDASADEDAADAPAETDEAEAPSETASAPAEPQVGQYYVRETHGDWTLRCIKTEDEADPCDLYQLLRDSGGNSVAEVTMIPLENGGDAVTGATLVAPLETDLTQGIRMQVDSGQARAYPFNVCAPMGCISRVGFTSGELNAMKRGNVATVSILPYGAPADQAVDLAMSLTGFTAGYEALETAVAELREAAEAADEGEGEGEAAPAQ
ncbi:invasion associated locus B family protein [Paracoccus sediminicola]|uniref:invasion associated locus B family protein n=1 Tax=Paracoccus sediminicola TaxID=3017783 RepID=UPI0022F095A5|nr:invasion associated locus B family protein [Paracoccus sediminicola]WBU57817.1 invasion associated locus B family protein [Paracoccus sediminicola]